MKKFYSLILIAIVGIISFHANAATVTINVDDPNRVDVQIAYVSQELVAGDNQFTVSDYTSISITAKDGNFLTSVQRRGSYSESVYNMTSCNLYVYYATDYDGVIWDVTSCNADEARDAEVVIIVDDASVVSCQRNNSYTYVNLANGENKVKFMSSAEVPLTFSHNAYGSTLYKVTHNGTDAEAQGSRFVVYPQNGDTIIVSANYPDVDVPIKFSYGEGAEGFITSLAVNGTTITDFSNDNFSVKLGSKVTIHGNTQDYKFDSMTINGSAISYFYGSYEFTATEESYEIVVNAHKYATFNTYITVDKAENVSVSIGNSYNTVMLESGVKTTVEVNENNPYIYWTASAGCFITSITVIQGDAVYDYTGSSSISATDGMEIKITTGEINRDKTAIIWIDDISLADYGGSFYGSYDRYLYSFSSLQSGYNTIEFFDNDNPFYMTFYGSTISSPVVYQNDVTVTGNYGNYTFADNDVIKVFLGTTEPASYNVSFTIETGNAEYVNVIRDIIKEVADWQNGFSTLQGTQVTISKEDGHSLGVALDENNLTPDENGNFIFTVNQDTNVKLYIDSSDSVEMIMTDQVSNVYNLQGILVLKNASNKQVSDLPTGLYIINGKKVAIRK